ncbi:hypothetical protein BD779DRAFT_1467740 [Infundibulicybe gibba]|nr:hypothetical protein BD779DRAFT_1467740 [Infundibulicybe gibba]
MVRLLPRFSQLLSLSLLAAAVHTANAHVYKRQCQATLNLALTVAHRLQDHYFNPSNGQYTGGSLWTDANTLEDLHNLMLATGTNDFSTVADTSFIGKAALNSATNWQAILNGSNDDAGWIVLALWKIADYKGARGLSNTAYLNSASTIYNIIAGQWDNTCGGGDHLDLQPRVIASGLAALSVANGDKTLLDQAEITLDATIAHLTTINILRESCDNVASGGAVCNQDQQIFKGIWTKHLQYYLDNANDPARTAKYSSFLGSQTSAVLHFGTNANNDVGSVWYGPDQGGSIFTPKTSASGLAAHAFATGQQHSEPPLSLSPPLRPDGYPVHYLNELVPCVVSSKVQQNRNPPYRNRRSEEKLA